MEDELYSGPPENSPVVCLELRPMSGFALTTADVLVQFADPCEEASKASMKCLERAHYNRNEVSYRQYSNWRSGLTPLRRSAWTTLEHIGNARRDG